jgi:hypothetical protein
MSDPPLDCTSMQVGALVCRKVLQEHDDLLGDALMAGGLELVEAVEKNVGARENSGRPTRLERDLGHERISIEIGSGSFEKDVRPGQAPVTPISALLESEINQYGGKPLRNSHEDIDVLRDERFVAVQK